MVTLQGTFNQTQKLELLMNGEKGKILLIILHKINMNLLWHDFNCNQNVFCKIFPDFPIFLLSGMIIGLLIKYLGEESRVAITQPNCTITSATKKLYIKAVNGSPYSYSLSGPVQQDNSSDQESELEQKASDVG